MSERPPETYREVEHKLRVHALYHLPDLTTVPASGVAVAKAEPRLTLRATYYDTADLRLARSRVTLRRREGGGDDGWHLKLPVDELRLPLDAGAKPPDELVDTVLALTRGAPLEPVATLETERAPVLLLADDGRLLAELTDDSVSVLDGSHVAARFRELEVEVRDGTPVELAAVVGALLASGAVESELPSKVVRALGPAAQAPADVVQLGDVGPGEPAGRAVQAYLAKHVAAFIEQDVRVRRELPDSVHQMRVAARRLRSGLKAFGPLLDVVWADALRSELAWIASELGALRDSEVQEARLLRDLDALPAVPHGHDGEGTAGVDRTDVRDIAAAAAVVRRVFDEERARIGNRLGEELTSQRYVTLLDTLVAAARAPRLSEDAQRPSSEALPPLLAKAWHRLRKRVHALDLQAPDATWHEARIAGKRARYTADALAPVLGGDAKRTAKRLEEVTELLGEHQDAVIAAETTRRLAAGRRVTGTTGFVLGLLHEYERAAVTAARHGFVELWPDVAAKKVVGWLDDA